jgi:hypothetical protein
LPPNSRQEFHGWIEHKLFAGGIAGLAAIGEPLPDWVDENVSPSIAWKALRETVYLELVGRTQES